MEQNVILNPNSCALCSSPIRKNGYTDATHSFCCAGCHAVYQILFIQNALENFHQHPLFQQAVRSGLISNPDIIEQINQKANTTDTESQKEELKKIHLEIRDMWCPSCAQVISLILMQEKGIQSCVVDYSTDLASIDYSPRYLSKEKLFQMIEQLGYRPSLLEDSQQKTVSLSLYVRFLVAAFCSANLMMFAYPIYASYFDFDHIGYAQLFLWLSGIGSLPVLTYSAWPIWRRLFTGLRVGIWGMEVLIFLGVSTAFGLSLYELWRGSSYVYFDSMTVIITFVLLGKIIESKAKFLAKDSLLRLTRGLPRRGRKRFSDGSERFVSLKEIHKGDVIIALTGEKIVLDGVVEEGSGACDESLMTGESWPVSKQTGASVLAGSILQQGRLVIKVSADSDETVLHSIISMVKQDIGYKSQYTRSVDRIVIWFVPLVLLLSLGTALYCWTMGITDFGYTVGQTALIRAISVLLISCPCAIGIAAPLAESHILNAFSKIGAIVRNRGCLPFLSQVTDFIFDKTGTITEGKFRVLSGLEKLHFDEQRILKGLVICSNHPISLAINEALLCFPGKMDHVEEIVGKGLKGQLGGNIYYLGSARFLKEQGIPFLQFDDSFVDISTRVFFAKNQQFVASILLGDRIRSDVESTIKFLNPIQTWLVSGDAATTVKRVFENCGFDQWCAESHPLQKRELVDRLRKRGAVVAMIGDGVNDAPALTAAHIGIAVVSATDVSIQVSDILLTTDRLEVIPKLLTIASKGQRIIKQNLFWAFFYNVIGIGLAMTGHLSPIFAAFAMVTSSLMVLLNAHRVQFNGIQDRQDRKRQDN